MTPSLHGARAARVFLCFALGYLLSYALRSVNAVIAPALSADLQLSNADLGLLSSAYFLSFGALQLPLGIWLDKYGARRTESALLLCAAAGAAVFATSTSLAGLWMGRALIGVGVSACLMAAFKSYRLWFAAEQQAQLASAMLVAGTAGALIASLPVSLALPHIGWRGVFWIFAALLLVAAALVFFALRGVERAYAHMDAHAHTPAGGYRRIFGSRYFWRFGTLGLVNHGLFIALQTLWAGPWMITVLGKTQQQAGEILFMFNLALMLAYLGMGLGARRLVARGWSVQRLIALGFGGVIVTQLAIVFAGGPYAWLLWLVLALCIPVTTLVQSHVAVSFPLALTGRANSAYNLQLFVGAFAGQWGFGLVVDALKAHGAAAPDAFRITLALAMLAQAGGLAQFLASRKAVAPFPPVEEFR